MVIKRVHKFILVLCLLVLAGGGAAALSLKSQTHSPRPIATIQPKHPVETQWPRFIQKGKYQTFQSLRQVLANGTASPSCLVAFEFVISDPIQLRRINTWAAKLDGPERSTALSVLYAELMLADSDAEMLYECAHADIERAFTLASKDQLNCGRYFAWALSRPAFACIIGYEATKQERFLDLVADAFERTLPFRDSELGRVDEVRGRIMHNWGTTQYSGDGRYSAEITTATRVTYPTARFVQFVRENPDLQSRFGDRADRFLPVIRETIDEFDSEYRTVEGTGQGYYLNVPRQCAEPVNHMAWAADCLLTLSQITNESKYRRMAEGIANYLKASMWTDERGCTVWRYMPQPENRRNDVPEHVWKSRVTIDLPIQFAQQGVVFSPQDMHGICRMFLTNVFRGNGTWSCLIESKFKDLASYGNERAGMLCVSDYIQLDHYDANIRTAIEELLATRPDVGGWLNHSHGIIAYAHRLKNPGFNAQRSGESLVITK